MRLLRVSKTGFKKNSNTYRDQADSANEWSRLEQRRPWQTWLCILHLNKTLPAQIKPTIATWKCLLLANFPKLNQKSRFCMCVWNGPVFKTLKAKQCMSLCLQAEFACKTTSILSLDLEHLYPALHNKIWIHALICSILFHRY